MDKKLNITVLLGGESAEREVSLASGAAVVSALRSAGYSVNELDPVGDDWSAGLEADVVFLALHGTFGEDGTVQERLDQLGICYTGSGMEASRVAFDKVRTKELLVKAGLPTPRYAVLNSPASSWPMGWKPPVVLKPVAEGSSVGLQFVERVADWGDAVNEVFRRGQPVLMEERVMGREVTVGILDGTALPVVEVRPRTGVYDYQSKYTPGSTEYFCPAPFDAAVTAQIQEVGLKAFEVVGCRDYGRVDMMVNSDGEPSILEINTLPGMTETSLLPKAAEAEGMSYVQLCERMIELAFKHGPERTRINNAA